MQCLPCVQSLLSDLILIEYLGAHIALSSLSLHAWDLKMVL